MTIYRGRQVKRVTQGINRIACRITFCDGEGYGGYCQHHTPREGTGVLLCGICEEPTLNHAITDTCVPSFLDGEGTQLVPAEIPDSEWEVIA